MKQIGRLALLNYRLNQALSVPHLIFILLNVCNAVLTFCMMTVCRVNAALLWHGTVTFLYLLYLLLLNRSIVHLLKAILTSLREGYLLKNNEGRRHPSQMTSTLSIYRQLKWTEAELYVAYFPIKLYHLLRLEAAFVFETGFFMLAYIVFITQTN